MIYEVTVYCDDFTNFSATKRFWFYKNAYNFALSKVGRFDYIVIEKLGTLIHAWDPVIPREPTINPYT